MRQKEIPRVVEQLQDLEGRVLYSLATKNGNNYLSCISQQLQRTSSVLPQKVLQSLTSMLSPTPLKDISSLLYSKWICLTNTALYL